MNIDPLLALKIRNLIVSREMNLAEANRELQCGDGWLYDHVAVDRNLNQEINRLIKASEAAKEAGND